MPRMIKGAEWKTTVSWDKALENIDNKLKIYRENDSYTNNETGPEVPV